MEELREHIVYDLLRNKYERLDLDYVILSLDEEYEGLKSHKKAVMEAFSIINERYKDSELSFMIDESKMEAYECNIEELLSLPDKDYDLKKKENNRAYTEDKPISYWYAFLESPHGNKYLVEDFIEFNEALFADKQDIEVYRWNDDFSDYFNAGKEWWGTGLWSAYNKKTNVITIIGASLTD